MRDRAGCMVDLSGAGYEGQGWTYGRPVRGLGMRDRAGGMVDLSGAGYEGQGWTYGRPVRGWV